MDERTAILSRMFVVLGLLLLIPCALGFQLIRINYLEGEELRELWSKQAVDSLPIPAQRGNIYDANGTLLATNAVDYKLAFDPKAPKVTSSHINQLSDKLGDLTGKGSFYFNNKIKAASPRSRYIVLANNLSVLNKDVIKSLDIPGVILEENYRRKYTFGSLSAHALGFVNHEMEGQIGLESFYNDDLKGEDGVRQVRRDPFNRIFEYVGAPKKLPRDGYSLHTTIDAYLQAILEDELEQGVAKTRAAYGTGVIMDPRTGAIKAIANYPTYNPNFPGSGENRRNFAISDMVEPGSTFKLVTAISAVEQNAVSFDEIFDTPDNGEVVIHNLILRDHDPLGSLNFQEVIQKSSNVATAEIAMRLKPEVFYQYARNLGFGNSTNIDLSGEENGRLAKPFTWSKVSLPWMSHGYEIQATPLQIAQAYAAFANDGLLMRPYLVQRIEDAKGNIIKEHEPIEIRRIAKTSTIKKLLPVFESVVSDSGTGRFAQVEGLPIAGKTGTAKKVIDGRYTNNYRGSFVGFFPVEDPKYVIMILLDEPKTSFYGGVTAGPIFKNVATRIAGLDSDIQRTIKKEAEPQQFLAQMPFLNGMSKQQAEELLAGLGLTSKINGNSGYVIEQQPEAGSFIDADDEIILNLSENLMATDENEVKEGFAKIPELRGMNMRQATALLRDLGLESTIIGSGTVFAQFPKSGELLRHGRAVTVRGKAKSLELLTAGKR